MTCSGGITVTAGAGSTWTAELPNSTAYYSFTASYTGNDSYHGANATFTVVHMFTTRDFGKTPGDTETPRVTNTASGLQFTVTGLSPISVGREQPSTPTTPPGPTGGGGGWSSNTYAVTVEKSEHGKVTSNRTNTSNGSTVTLTVTPDSWIPSPSPTAGGMRSG